MLNYQRVKLFAVCFQENSSRSLKHILCCLKIIYERNSLIWRVREARGLLQKYVQIILDHCHCCGPSSGWQSCLEMGQEPCECALPMYFQWCRFCTVNSDARLCETLVVDGKKQGGFLRPGSFGSCINSKGWD